MTGSREALLAASAIILLTGIGGCLLILSREAENVRIAQRLSQIGGLGGPEVDRRKQDEAHLWVRAVIAVGNGLARSGLLPSATRVELMQTLTTSGLRGNHALGMFIGAKALLTVIVSSLFWALVHTLSFQPMMHYVLPAVGAVIGLLAPDFIIRRMRKKYLATLEAGMPDALDMLVICTEAGLGIEPGFQRVSEEFMHSNAVVARELQITVNEMRVVVDRRQVLINLGIRTGLESMRRLGTTLNQATQFGTPLGQALRTLASEMRHESMMRYEAQAARLPVMLTLPMILFILPCVLIVVVGPAALEISTVFSKH